MTEYWQYDLNGGLIDGGQRHAVLLVAYNNLELTREAVNSVLAQDIGDLDITLISNGSTDGTEEYFEEVRAEVTPLGKHRIRIGSSDTNISPNIASNRALHEIFHRHDKVLCVANDVILPPNFYRLLNQWPRGMVTASMTDQKDFPVMEKATATSACTPMAVLLLRRWCYEAVVSHWGHFFDEGFFCYASDNDLALRMSACGIRGVQTDLAYWHFGSSTWRLAPEAERTQMLQQADRDREYFRRKWGFPVDEQAYVDAANDLNFTGKAKL